MGRLGCLRQGELGRQSKVKGLHGGILRILRGIFDLHLIEVTGMLQLRDEIGDGVDRSGRALNREGVTLAIKRSEPECVGARDGVGKSVEQLLTTGAIALQFLNYVDALREDLLLALKLVDLRLQVLQSGLFAALLLDVRLNFDDFLIHGIPVVVKDAQRNHQGRNQEHQLQCSLQRYSLARGFGSSPSK